MGREETHSQFDGVVLIVVLLLLGAYVLHVAGKRVGILDDSFTTIDSSLDDALGLSRGTARLLSDHGWFPDRYVDSFPPVRRLIVSAVRKEGILAKMKARCVVHLWRSFVAGLVVALIWLVWVIAGGSRKKDQAALSGSRGEVRVGYQIRMRPLIAFFCLRFTTTGRRLTKTIVQTVRTPEVVELCLEIAVLYASYPRERLQFGAGRDGGPLHEAILDMLQSFRRQKWPAVLKRDRRTRDLAVAAVMAAPLGKLDAGHRGEGVHHFLGAYHEHKSRMLLGGLKAFHALPEEDRQRLVLWVGSHHSGSLPDEWRHEADVARFVCHVESCIIGERADRQESIAGAGAAGETVREI